GVSSLVTAMCANSPLSRGGANGFLSKRSHIWLHTDPDRTGLLSFALAEGASYSDYVAYALRVPMLFVVRDGRWIDMTERTFSSYLEGQAAGLTPTVADWELHLTTLFPEVRLKAYLEVRGSDSGPPQMILAQAALWKGILYDAGARKAAWDLVEGPTFEQRLAFHRDVARSGLRARLGGRPALELSRALLSIAERGLPATERGHLTPLMDLIVGRGMTPAESILASWSSEWGHDPKRLVASLAPDPRLLPA
ncbi:MAG TPA: glutamate-cysteine ligase family protein, partial [Candidatus Polarisedimenticolia bacterium]|nr:glutamate-cysteine ligase family protein [Candidatus Polarisedimenticolia bacterium]